MSAFESVYNIATASTSTPMSTATPLAGSKSSRSAESNQHRQQSQQVQRGEADPDVVQQLQQQQRQQEDDPGDTSMGYYMRAHGVEESGSGAGAAANDLCHRGRPCNVVGSRWFLRSVQLVDTPAYLDGSQASPSNALLLYNNAFAFHDLPSDSNSTPPSSSSFVMNGAAPSATASALGGGDENGDGSGSTLPHQSELELQQRYNQVLSAVFHYNTGLILHQDALLSGDSRSFIRALGLYHASLTALMSAVTSTKTGVDGTPDSDAVDSSYSKRHYRADLVLLELAIYNNMGHIHSHFFNHFETRTCLELMRRRLVTALELLQSGSDRDALIIEAHPYHQQDLHEQLAEDSDIDEDESMLLDDIIDNSNDDYDDEDEEADGDQYSFHNHRCSGTFYTDYDFFYANLALLLDRHFRFAPAA